jgi:hypothetical protein
MTDTHAAARIPLPVAVVAPALTPGLRRLLAAAVGTIALPLYAPQPLVDRIGPAGWTLVCVVGPGFVALALSFASIERTADDDAEAGGNE